MCSHKNRLIEAILMSTHNIPFSIYKKKIALNCPKSAAMAFFSMGLKNKFETAVVNEPSVFEPLKFYCILSVNASVQLTATVKSLSECTVLQPQ